MPEPAKTSKCPNDKDFYADVNYCQGSISLPGVRNHFFFIPRRYIVKWPEVSESAASLEDVAKLAGEFTLEADKKWIRVDTVDNKAELVSDQVGLTGNKHFRNSIELPIPGTEEKATGLINMICNEDAIFLIPQRNGKYRLIGNPMFPNDITTSQKSGEGHEDQNSTNIKIEGYDTMAAPFFPGKITTADGDISGADGKLIVLGA